MLHNNARNNWSRIIVRIIFANLEFPRHNHHRQQQQWAVAMDKFVFVIMSLVGHCHCWTSHQHVSDMVATLRHDLYRKFKIGYYAAVGSEE